MAGASCRCPTTTMLQVSAVMEAFAGSVYMLAVVAQGTHGFTNSIMAVSKVAVVLAAAEA
jgi:hypothetical protein